MAFAANELTSQTETNLHKESYGRIEIRRQVTGKKHNINPSTPSLRTTRLFLKNTSLQTKGKDGL